MGQLDYLKVKLDDDFLKKAALVLDSNGRPVDMNKVATEGNLEA